MHGVDPDVPIPDIFLGVAPMVIGDITVIASLISFPGLATWLPSKLMLIFPPKSGHGVKRPSSFHIHKEKDPLNTNEYGHGYKTFQCT